jgi:ADP-dependent phosphofructokinase/glucokinase
MRIICGYNVNLDSVCTVTDIEITAHLQEQRLLEGVLRGLESPSEGIYSVEDFFCGLLLCMKRGRGVEWLIFNPEVVEFLKEHFMEHSEVILGGNAGNMAKVLSELGAELVVPNIASPSARQAGLLRGDNIRIPVPQGEDFVLVHPMDADVEGGEVIHFVFNFSKGTHIHLRNLDFMVPRGDRFIATYDPANIELTVNPHFEEFCERYAANFDGALLAGFHLLLEEYPDGSTYQDKIERFVEHTRCWKRRNPRMFIHVELGYFNSERVESCVLENLMFVDSLGMNEVELARCNLVRDDSKLIQSVGSLEVESIHQAAIRVLKATGLGRICIHTSEFVVSVFRKGFINPWVELEALDFGAKTAAAYAATGIQGNREYVRQATRNMPLSEPGLVQLEELKEKWDVESAGSSAAFMEQDSCYVCVVVSPHCEKPITTVGLGDTFTAATFLRELELSRQGEHH